MLEQGVARHKEIVSGRQAAQIMRAPLNIGFDLRGHALLLTLFPLGLQTDCDGFILGLISKTGPCCGRFKAVLIRTVYLTIVCFVGKALITKTGEFSDSNMLNEERRDEEE